MLKKIDSIHDGEFLYEVGSDQYIGLRRATSELISYSKNGTNFIAGKTVKYNSFSEASQVLLKTYR